MVLFLSGRWRLADGMLLGLADFVSRCGYSVEGPVIDLERFAGAVASCRMRTTLLSFRRHRRDPAAFLASIQGLRSETTASLAPGRDEVEGEDRQGVDCVLGEDDGVRPVGFPRHPEAAARGGAGRREAAWRRGRDDLGAESLAGRVSADEHGVAVAVRRASRGRGTGRRAHPRGRGRRGSLDGGPVAVRARGFGWRSAGNRSRHGEAEGLGHGAPAGMDYQVDRSAPAAQMFVEHKALDGSGTPPARGAVGSRR